MAGERVPEPDRARLEAATAHLEPPFAVVDLDAFDANAADLLRRAAGKPLRLAVEVRALPRAAGPRAGRRLPRAAGFTLPEALWLADRGARRPARGLSHRRPDGAARRWPTTRTRAAITVMVDAVAHLDLVDRCRHGRTAAPRCASAIDLDA